MNKRLLKRIVTTAKRMSIACSKKEPYIHLTFICKGSNIIVVGRNQKSKTHTIAKKYEYPYSRIHSELDAIIKYNRKNGEPINKMKIVNIRVGRQGQLMNSKPCFYCINMLKSLDVKGVTYTNSNGEFVETDFYA